MDKTLQLIPAWLQLVTAYSLVIAALSGSAAVVWHYCRGGWKGMRRMEDIWPVLTDLDTMAKDVKAIKAQVFSNGGSSPVDAINRIERRLENGDERFALIEEQHKMIINRLDRRTQCPNCSQTSPLLRRHDDAGPSMPD